MLYQTIRRVPPTDSLMSLQLQLANDLIDRRTVDTRNIIAAAVSQTNTEYLLFIILLSHRVILE